MRRKSSSSKEVLQCFERGEDFNFDFIEEKKLRRASNNTLSKNKF